MSIDRFATSDTPSVDPRLDTRNSGTLLDSITPPAKADDVLRSTTDKPADNWADKSRFRCETCQYFSGGVLGRCRRHAPTLAGWPAVYYSDFCGDHKMPKQP